MAAVLLAGAASVACGRKGPPLAPLIEVPAPIQDLEARRLGDEVYLTFTVPAQNVDGSTPAALDRVDVFALTASEPPSQRDVLTTASRVASIAVAPPADDEPAEEVSEPAPATQGQQITVRDVLEPVAATGAGDDDASARRYYVAVGVSNRERSSESGRIASIPATPAPEAPAALAATHTADSIRLAWAPAEGAVSYNVYAESAGEGETDSPATGLAQAPVPLNDMPLAEPAYAEPIAAFGQERCYRVRAVRTAGEAAPVASAPSVRACVTPVDRFPPAAPTDLVAVAGPDGIALRWAANREADLAGYLILRGTPPDVTLLPVTSMPVVESQYLDRDVVPGTRYVYAVVAVDAREPPNVSEESARDAATAR